MDRPKKGEKGLDFGLSGGDVGFQKPSTIKGPENGPKPAPCAVGDVDEPCGEAEDSEFWVDDLNPNHLMTHFPKCRTCDTCLQAKLYESPHRRRENQRETLKEIREKEEPEDHLERISVDFIVASDSVGICGENVALVMVDRFSGLIGVHSCETRSAEEAEEGLRHFCGTVAPNIVEVSSDRHKGILKASRNLGFVVDPAPPNVKIHNPIAEAAIRTVKGSVSSLLLHAGMKPDHWPLAIRYFEFSYNINTMSRTALDPPVTCFEAAHSYQYEGYMIPFGALVWFRGTGGKSFEPKGRPAIYLGAELIHGMKFKGNHIIWPLENCLKGVYRETVVTTLAIPNGKWRFPLKASESSQGMAPIQSYVPPPDLETIEEGEIEFDSLFDHPKGSGEGGPSNKKDTEGTMHTRMRRNRAITTIRIGIFGRTPKCDGCKLGTYGHTKACRERFNRLLDENEPIKPPSSGITSGQGKGPASSAHEGGTPDIEEAFSDGERGSEPSYLPSTIADPDPGDIGNLGDLDTFDDSNLNPTPEAKALIASGKIQNLVLGLEKGSTAVSSICFEAIELGGAQEEPLSQRLAKAMTAQVAGRKPVGRPKGQVWFVEFCCSSNSEIRKVCEDMSIPYIGLSRDVCDLTNPHHMHQVMLWAQERKDAGDSFHLWGSLPCTPWCSWQHVNRHVLGEEFDQDLQTRREESKILVENFSSLADVGVESGGSATFEWPRFCSGWVEVEELTDMLTKHSMFSTYPTGCAFGLTIKGLKPLKPWRIITTHERLALELDSRRCCHPKGYCHDRLAGGRLAYLSGFYNHDMAVSILCSLYPDAFMRGVPSMPTVPTEEGSSDAYSKWGRISGQLSEGKCFQHAQALVHRVLSKKEIEGNPKAIEAIQKEAHEVRQMQVWDDNSVCELNSLKQWARQTDTQVHIAEVMAIGSIKHDELGPTLSQHKGRLVFRGDASATRMAFRQNSRNCIHNQRVYRLYR